MQASNLIKTLIAISLLSGAFVAGGASADNGRSNPAFCGFGGYSAPYQQFDRDERPDFRYGNEHTLRYVDQMQARQRARIQQGIRSGELTPFEARRLMAEQRNIERLQYQYLADGRLSPHERQRLMAELEDASRHIWSEKHDAEDRYDYRAPRFAYR